jgi:hypothetical protein
MFRVSQKIYKVSNKYIYTYLKQIYIYIYTHTHIYIYTHIYIFKSNIKHLRMVTFGVKGRIRGVRMGRK